MNFYILQIQILDFILEKKVVVRRLIFLILLIERPVINFLGLCCGCSFILSSSLKVTIQSMKICYFWLSNFLPHYHSYLPQKPIWEILIEILIFWCYDPNRSQSALNLKLDFPFPRLITFLKICLKLIGKASLIPLLIPTNHPYFWLFIPSFYLTLTSPDFHFITSSSSLVFKW